LFFDPFFIMDYQKIYNQIVERAKSRLLEGYSEKHHIIPKCLGGSNEYNNIIILTAREHYICHWLLIRIYPQNSKLIYAFWMMSTSSRYNVSSRSYEEARQLQSVIRSQKMKGHNTSILTKEKISKSNKGKLRTKEHRIRISNSLKGNTIWIGKTHTKESKQKMSDAKKGKVAKIETKQKMSEIKKGRKHSDEAKQKMSIGMTGISKRKVECIHCKLMISSSNIIRHENSCKQKHNVEDSH